MMILFAQHRLCYSCCASGRSVVTPDIFSGFPHPAFIELSSNRRKAYNSIFFPLYQTLHCGFLHVAPDALNTFTSTAWINHIKVDLKQRESEGRFDATSLYFGLKADL
jgi:hypothetical protein